MHEVILSVGIDIGTSTTQLIFSRLTIENRASSYTVPRIDIVDKEVIYRSKIYFTPLRSATEIDAEAVKRIVREEYQAAGMTPEMLRTGAVIITGETARKENANEVLEALSDLAGDFVVATAGPDLESVLSARGAGTDALSKEKRTAIANVDIGGGTSNIAVYEKGVLRGTCEKSAPALRTFRHQRAAIIESTKEDPAAGIPWSWWWRTISERQFRNALERSL